MNFISDEFLQLCYLPQTLLFIKSFRRLAIDSPRLNIFVRNFFEIYLKYNFIEYINSNICGFISLKKILKNCFFSSLNVYNPLIFYLQSYIEWEKVTHKYCHCFLIWRETFLLTSRLSCYSLGNTLSLFITYIFQHQWFCLIVLAFWTWNI